MPWQWASYTLLNNLYCHCLPPLRCQVWSWTTMEIRPNSCGCHNQAAILQKTVKLPHLVKGGRGQQLLPLGSSWQAQSSCQTNLDRTKLDSCHFILDFLMFLIFLTFEIANALILISSLPLNCHTKALTTADWIHCWVSDSLKSGLP